jgi:hypothetical protein
MCWKVSIHCPQILYVTYNGMKQFMGQSLY